MPRGFFSGLQQVGKVRDLHAPRCGECGLFKTCKSPKMPVHGEGKKKILVVGEAPGATEDELNRPFVGKAGHYLREKMGQVGLDLDGDCWVTNALACRPPGNAIANDRMVDWCRPNVTNAIRTLKPVVILLLGKRPMESVIKWLWKDIPMTVGTWVGWKVPAQKVNAWVCPTWHPSYLMRGEEDEGGKRVYNEVEKDLFVEHLRVAKDLADGGNRPWKAVPDYKKSVRIAYNADEAAAAVKAFRLAGSPTAFDFETDRLKPDAEDSEIVCCAVSDGKTSVSFPWVGIAIGEMKKYLTSDVPKIGANVKFESRWVMRHLGCQVNNWVWDTVLDAHCLDNRPGITSVKFQAFARLGVEDYDSHVKPYLEAPGGNARNRIRELDLGKVLTYCALDALLEYKVAKIQAREMGVRL